MKKYLLSTGLITTALAFNLSFLPAEVAVAQEAEEL